MMHLGSSPVSVEVEVSPRARDDVAGVAAGEARGSRVVLELIGVRFHQAPEPYEVYLNLPAGTVPRHDSPHYVGNIAVFGPRGAAQSFQLDVSETVRALAARGAWDPQRVRVTLAPSSLELPPGVELPSTAPATRGSVERVTLTAY